MCVLYKVEIINKYVHKVLDIRIISLYAVG